MPRKTRASAKHPAKPALEPHHSPTAQEPTPQDIINVKRLQWVESGEKERLKELLRERLIECGWRDEMKALCRTVSWKKGRNTVMLDDLVLAITPKGRASIPDTVKAELLQHIRSFLASAT